MNSFTQREREKKSRSAAEITTEMKGVITESQARHLSNYIAENRDAFTDSNRKAYYHVFTTTIGGMNGAIDIAEMENNKKWYEHLIDTIDSTKNMSQSSTWPDFFEDGEKHDALKVVRLFREEIEKGFTDGKINETTKNNGIEIADKLKETYNKLRELSEELEIAIGKSTTTITR